MSQSDIGTILLLGASGLLGRVIYRHLRQNGKHVVGTHYHHPLDETVGFDIGDHGQLAELINRYQPQVIINAIAERDITRTQQDWNYTLKINTDLVERILTLYDRPSPRRRPKSPPNQHSFHLIQISTDYIFDGRNPPYNIDSLPNPLQNYGISKLLAELKIKASNCPYTIIRIPVLYSSDVRSLDECSPFQCIIPLFDLTLDTITADAYNSRHPTSCQDVAVLIEGLLNADNLLSTRQTVNYNSSETFTKYQITMAARDILNVTTRVKPCYDKSPSRPRDTFMVGGIASPHSPPAGGIASPHGPPAVNIKTMEDPNTAGGSKGAACPLVLRGVIERYRLPDLRDDKPFLLLDLDGTLLDTDQLHYQAYAQAIREADYRIEWNQDLFGQLIQDNSVDSYLLQHLSQEQFIELKSTKQANMMSIGEINTIFDGELLISYILEHDINYCVVTNTTRQTVEHYQRCNSLFARLKHIVTREDYVNRKPARDAYDRAISLYYRGEGDIVAIDNSIGNLNTLKLFTDKIVLMGNEKPQIEGSAINFPYYLCNSFKRLAGGPEVLREIEDFSTSCLSIKACPLLSN